MQAQEIFETVVKHLMTMGRRSGYVEPNGMPDGNFACRYRTKHGDKCAAGIFIPDELYLDNMEGLSIQTVINDNPALPRWMAEHRQLLGRLQLIHDREYWDRLESGFRAVADDFELDTSILAQYDFTQFIGKRV